MKDEGTTCRKCNARIRFVKNPATDKWQPVDFNPVRVHAGSEEGTFVFESGEVRHSRNLTEDAWGYVSHFATCPAAKEFRKR